MLEQSLILLFSGMLTVFTVLGLVVLMGKLLIYIVNNFFSSSEQTKNTDALTPIQQQTKAETLAVIAAAVDIATAGKGRVTDIELLSQDDDIRDSTKIKYDSVFHNS